VDEGLIEKPLQYWEEKTNRRDFFIDFAKEMGFDPMEPKNWQKIKKADIAVKVASVTLFALNLLTLSY